MKSNADPILTCCGICGLRSRCYDDLVIEIRRTKKQNLSTELRRPVCEVCHDAIVSGYFTIKCYSQGRIKRGFAFPQGELEAGPTSSQNS